MPQKSKKDLSSGGNFVDKALSVAGIKRPKKRSAISRRKSPQSEYAKEIKKPKTNSGDRTKILLNDDFQISGTAHYGEGVTARKPGKAKDGKKAKSKHPVLRALFLSFIVFVIACCVVVSAFLIYVFAFVDGTMDVDLHNLRLDHTSILFATVGEGEEAERIEIRRLHGVENRLWVDLEYIPEHLQQAFISGEDKRFMNHAGVDWRRTATVTLNLAFGFLDRQEGGSTITQQLVKNITGDDAVTIPRKIREIMRARYLERRNTKDVILEGYLNTIHLGPGVDGVEVAANFYFDKNVTELTLAQAAAIAAVAPAPNDLNPYTNYEANRRRRNWILREMVNNGFITEEEREEAANADLGLRDTPSTVLTGANTIEQAEEYNSYFVDAVIEDVITALMEEREYTYEHAESELYRGGFMVYTTICLDVQQAMEEVYADDSNFTRVGTDEEQPQSAMTVMDYQGRIRGIVGGRGEKIGNRVLNRATQSPRQPGSAIKPISVYAPAVEFNIITWGTFMNDAPIARLANGLPAPDGRWPRNYGGTFSGRVGVPRALQQSLNTIPVHLVQQIGIETAFNFLRERMGITTLVEDENGMTDMGESSLALGGSVRGVTTVEMAAAFATFGNGGVYHRPRTFTRILDRNGDVVIDLEDNYHRAISEATAGVMNRLSQTVTTSGTATAAQFDRWPIISKTGTTDEHRDRWFVGGTPYYMGAVWFGFDGNEPMRGLGANPAIPVWRTVMRRIHENRRLADFAISDRVQHRRYCRGSGLAARSGCFNTGFGFFKASYVPFCNHHRGMESPALSMPSPVGGRTVDMPPGEVEDEDADVRGTTTIRTHMRPVDTPRTTTTRRERTTTTRERDRTTTTTARGGTTTTTTTGGQVVTPTTVPPPVTTTAPPVVTTTAPPEE